MGGAATSRASRNPGTPRRCLATERPTPASGPSAAAVNGRRRVLLRPQFVAAVRQRSLVEQAVSAARQRNDVQVADVGDGTVADRGQLSTVHRHREPGSLGEVLPPCWPARRRPRPRPGRPRSPGPRGSPRFRECPAQHHRRASPSRSADRQHRQGCASSCPPRPARRVGDNRSTPTVRRGRRAPPDPSPRPVASPGNSIRRIPSDRSSGTATGDALDPPVLGTGCRAGQEHPPGRRPADAQSGPFQRLCAERSLSMRPIAPAIVAGRPTGEHHGRSTLGRGPQPVGDHERVAVQGDGAGRADPVAGSDARSGRPAHRPAVGPGIGKPGIALRRTARRDYKGSSPTDPATIGSRIVTRACERCREERRRPRGRIRWWRVCGRPAACSPRTRRPCCVAERPGSCRPGTPDGPPGAWRTAGVHPRAGRSSWPADRGGRRGLRAAAADRGARPGGVRLAAATGRPDPVVLDLCCGTGAIAAVVGGRPPDCRDPRRRTSIRTPCAGRGATCRARRCTSRTCSRRSPTALRRRIDVLAVNAPYVPTGAIALMPPEASEHEHRIALDGGPDGLDLHRRVIAEARSGSPPAVTCCWRARRTRRRSAPD